MSEDQHHGPKPPDTSKLWVDESWGAIADGVASGAFWITFISAAIYIGVVIVWIFL